MPSYKGKKYSYDAKGKSAMKRDMMADAKKSGMKSRLKSLRKKT
tara:strand:- start:120 stop:251 length:132 start_codon:yes stop_codon:yes gene_type:complete